MLSDLISTPPTRTSVQGDAAPDDSAAIFGLLQAGRRAGVPGALLTLVDSVGGSARPVGAQMAVLADGRFTGYLSSGCLEAALAAEAIKQIGRRQNAILRFGAGSPFFDIRLPCGGSIDLLVDVTLTDEQVDRVADGLTRRRPISLLMGRHAPARLVEGARRTGWHEETFTRAYAPPLQIVALGRGLEFEAVAKLAAAAGYPVQAFCPDEICIARLAERGIRAGHLATPQTPPPLSLDADTAVILLFHDHEWETALLSQALNSPCRYIGAMGSVRTHQQRCERLLSAGHSLAEIDRIRGPIGLFGPTRDASSLAISVMAELAQITAAK